MSLVMRVSDLVTVLNFGRKLAEASPAEVRRHPEVIRAYLGGGGRGAGGWGVRRRRRPGPPASGRLPDGPPRPGRPRERPRRGPPDAPPPRPPPVPLGCGRAEPA